MDGLGDHSALDQNASVVIVGFCFKPSCRDSRVIEKSNLATCPYESKPSGYRVTGMWRWGTYSFHLVRWAVVFARCRNRLACKSTRFRSCWCRFDGITQISISGCGNTRAQMCASENKVLFVPHKASKSFPLLLSKGSPFFKTYVSYLHVTNCHAGPRALVSLLREKIWLVNAQEACRRTDRSCIRCFRCKPQLLTQIMGKLPSDRVRALRPFNICGVDFCGPFNTTCRIRGKPPYHTFFFFVLVVV